MITKHLGKIEKICLTCGNTFFVFPCNEKITKFCSHECYSKYPKSESNIKKISEAKIKHIFNKYELEYWYCGLGRNCREIANYCDVNIEVVWRHLKKHGVVLHTIGGGNRGKPHGAFWNAKIGYAQRGRIVPEEEKIQISEKVKKLWENPEYVSMQMRGRAIRPNRLEDTFIKLLKRNNITNFKYTGDFSYMIGIKNPDFVNINNKQVIDLFGNFYHEKYEVPERISYFKEYGFNTLILWESEFKNLESVLVKVKDFIGDKQ